MDFVRTGNDQLDFILGGGLRQGSFYLIEGDPGAGKTTLALQFALEGVRHGESVMYLALSENETDLKTIADSHGWSLDDIQIVDFTPSAAEANEEKPDIMFHPSEFELGEVMGRITSAIGDRRPERIILDSLAEVRHLAQSQLRYRRQLIALKSFFRNRHSTVLLLDDRLDSVDLQLQSVARGTISLERRSPNYGRLARRMQVSKMRGQRIRTGYHDFVIATGGVKIFPRLVASEHTQDFKHGAVSSGVEELDSLLGGGIQKGTSTLVMGSAGTGKSSLCSQYAVAAAERGERAAIFIFDETAGNFLSRCDGLGFPVRRYRESGLIELKQIDSAEISPGGFAWRVRNEVEEKKATLVVIDSLNGYYNAMPDENYLKGQLHELLSYLAQTGAATLLTLSQRGLVGEGVESPVETSYLADSLILLRYFEYAGAVRKAISVVKKRTGGHETTIREFALDAKGIRIGQPLHEFRGVLTGTPEYIGGADPLLGSRDRDGID